MSILEEGRIGEVKGREWLIAHGFRVFQADWIAFNPRDNTYFTVEVKNQAMFMAPPFDGHGLPLWEVKARLAFQRAVGVRAILLVLDKATQKWFWQFLDVLESGESYDTKGSHPRRVYPVKNFKCSQSVMPFEPPIQRNGAAEAEFYQFLME